MRSLQAAYPVIAQLIGEEAFGHLARDFWEQHPPKHGDLAQWGDELSGLINRIPALQTEPYLADIARAEWALHTAATAAEQAADFASFSLLTEYDPAALTLQLAAGTAVITSNYPIASILTAHLYNQPSFTEVGNLLRHTVAQHALVWRAGLRPMVASCSAGEAAFVSQLQHGDSLLAALDSLPLNNSHNFDLNTWLPHAVQTGLLLGVRSH